MASQRGILIVLVILSVLAVSATARPCKTLLISSYSLSIRRIPSSSSPSGFFTVLTEIRQLRPMRLTNDGVLVLDEPQPQQLQQEEVEEERIPITSSSSDYDLSSLRDRTKDILSVVVALLFGVGCGALTAATMYLAWSLFSSRNSYDDDEDDVSPKKVGYVMIPDAKAAPAAAV